MSAVVLPYVIPADASDPEDYPVIWLNGATLCGLVYPSNMGITNVSLEDCSQSGRFIPLAPGGIPWVDASSDDGVTLFTSNVVRQFRPTERFILRTATSESFDRTLKLIKRHIG